MSPINQDAWTKFHLGSSSQILTQNNSQNMLIKRPNMELINVTKDQLMNEIPMGFQMQMRESNQSISPLKF